MPRIVRKAAARHLSACDIRMLIATCLIVRGLTRRKRIRPCRPWIRFAPLPAPHSASPSMLAHCRRQRTIETLRHNRNSHFFRQAHSARQ
ncbi:hypothetical protein C7A17_13380 [Ectopseudomonas mendocina]|uniref:Protein GbcA n=1 Tax=Ectopseudomonas mendocina TaxID=300 RepID=A0A2R3QX02_ECTME|nr:hypothetical protein C7A17_13380 [Pseudomonas mendocina]